MSPSDLSMHCFSMLHNIDHMLIGLKLVPNHHYYKRKIIYYELPSYDHLLFERTVLSNSGVDVNGEESTSAVKDGVKVTH